MKNIMMGSDVETCGDHVDIKNPAPEAIRRLFHKAWREAHDSPDYNKATWNELRNEVEKALGCNL